MRPLKFIDIANRYGCDIGSAMTDRRPAEETEMSMLAATYGRIHDPGRAPTPSGRRRSAGACGSRMFDELPPEGKR
jgi:hypothetical protein